MPEIAGGFVAFRREQLGVTEETPESLQEIYRASLSLLYKMLFLLYAEARSLLPMDNPDYRANSLTAIAEWAAEQADARRNLSRATYATPHYDRLLALFRRIDRGDPALGIPEYNGGLFSPKSVDNRFLEQHKLSDYAVARAVDLLVRDQGQPVDYAFISVRNLGSIYEGLLENKLTLTPGPSPKGGGEQNSPLPSGEGLGVRDVRVYLINDKGERKATGSYYTPDYIVEYIVRNTLDPILDRRQANYAAAMERVTDLRGQLLRVRDNATANRLRAELEDAERAAREAFLGIKVLDPAMGSGHFLVNAVDHLTDGIIQRMQTWHDAHLASPWEWDPIQQLIEKVRTEIRHELEASGLPVDSRLNDDTALLMRLVMKRCIYGVDLNPMAVELARVSLWLHTFTVGAPLSFLDHHLRWGNSLIGTDVRTVENSIKVKAKEARVSANAKRVAKGRGETARESILTMQSSLFGGPFAGLLDLTSVMLDVAERADATLSDVRQSAQLYDDFQKQLIPYKQALNLWVSQYFGNPDSLEFMELFGDDVLPAIRGERPVAAQYKTALENAQTLWNEKRFFHWDLEFPEVFVDLRGRDWAQNGGFDAVIGNPPYVATGDLRSIDLKIWEYYKKSYESASSGKFDIYLPFFEKAWKLSSSHSGRSCFILPNKWVKSDAGGEFRKFLKQNKAIDSLLDFGSMQVFQGQGQDKGPTTYTCVCTLSRAVKDQIRYCRTEKPNTNNLAWETVEYSSLGDSWSFGTGYWQKLTGSGYASLESVANIFVGTTTNADDVFIVDQISEQGELLNVFSRAEERVIEIEKEICIPFLRGKDIDRYLISNPNLLVIFPYEKGTANAQLIHPEHMAARFPLAWKYLQKHRAILENREDGKWRGKSDWYCHAYPRNYGFINSQKLLTPDICVHGQFSIDNNGDFHFLNTAYGIANPRNNISLVFILSVLNTKLFESYIRANSVDLRGGYYRVTKTFMSSFPIRQISFTTPVATRTAEVTRAQALYSADRLDEILALAQGWLAAGQADIVHDLLAFLAGQMIDLNKARQEEMKGFLAHLSREIHAELDDLTGKTTIQNYLGDYQKGESEARFESILDVLRKNQKKLGADVSSRAFQQSLAREYQSSLGVLLPLKNRLAATDRLIDQVVYALYGLGEDEIRVVEGRSL